MFACCIVITEVFKVVNREREIHRVKDVSKNFEENFSFSAMKQHWKPRNSGTWFGSAPLGATSGTPFILSEHQVSYFSHEERELCHVPVRTIVFIDISSPLRTKTRQPIEPFCL